ncbi:MAG: hypothetical protein HOF01_06785 [Chloroflexi bacterium]|jgi:hypothetical protein|nr:hypothetical protein [Chloroflexota bacterium]
MDWLALIIAITPFILGAPLHRKGVIEFSRRGQDGWLLPWQLIDAINQWYGSRTGRSLIPSKLRWVITLAVVTQSVWIISDIFAIYGVLRFFEGDPSWWFSVAWFWSFYSRFIGMSFAHVVIQKQLAEGGISRESITKTYFVRLSAVVLQPFIGVPAITFRLILMPIEKIAGSRRLEKKQIWAVWAVLLAVAVVGSQLK